MITDLVQIKLLGTKQREENLRFRRHMKSHDHSDRILRRIAETIEDQIDCRQCANCCRETDAPVTQRDVDRLARHFRVKGQRIMADYVVESDSAEEPYRLRRHDNGECIFLSGNECTVYDARPEVCQRYPHLVRGSGSIASRMWAMADRAAVCPIVYNALEAFKVELKFRK